MTPRLASMTGFGSAQLDCDAGRLALEIKSVNSRFFELHPRMPEEFRWAEGQLRDAIQKQVSRGKIELRLSLQRTEAALAATQINAAGLASALRLSHQIRQDHPEIAPYSVADLLRLPGVLEESQLSHDEWSRLLGELVQAALAAFTESRQREGERLASVIEDRLCAILAHSKKAQALVPQAITQQEERLIERLTDALQKVASSGPALNAEQLTALQDRVRQEAALFGLRIDVAEELDRLSSHVQAMRSALTLEKGVGKRLDFLAQEMNREANTLGSKSPSTELSSISIELKLLIEQIREQAQNLE